MRDLDGITLVEGEKITWEDAAGATQFELYADSVPGSPETRDIYLAITPALGGRTVRRLFGFSGTILRSDFLGGTEQYITSARPSASSNAGKIIYVTDGAAGAKFQGSDGSNWLPLDIPLFTLADGSVTTAKLADGAVNGAKVLDGSLGLGELSASGTKDATTFLRGDNSFVVPPFTDITALSAITPNKIAWESPAGTDIVELYGSVTAAGIVLAQSDQLNSDTRANYAAFGNGAPNFASTQWQTGGMGAGYYLMAAPTAWGNADDQGRIRARGAFGSSSTFGVGFVKPGSIAQASLITIELTTAAVKLAYDGPWNIGGGVQFGSISVPSLSAGTFYVLEATRSGNDIIVVVKDSADSTTILAATTVNIPAGAPRTAYGAGVALRPTVVMDQLGGTGDQVDWVDYYVQNPEQRDLFAAITPAGGARTVRRLLGWSGSVLERSDLPLDASVTIAKLAATGTKDLTTVLRGDNTWGQPSGNGAPNTQTANYTLALTDAGKTVEMNLGTALTLTVPPNSSVAFPIGSIVEVSRHGAGTVAIAAGAGVTIRSRGALLSIGNQYGAVSLRKRATDEWVLVGDLA
jgi:hypothetical protein